MNPITREESLLDGQDLEPITRKEQFIKRIYDKTQEIPEPITREGYFLKKAGEGTSPVTIEQLNVTENGTYSETGKAYSPVIVEVPAPTLITKTITENGTYTASADNADGYSQVTASIPLPQNAKLITTAESYPITDAANYPLPKCEVTVTNADKCEVIVTSDNTITENNAPYLYRATPSGNKMMNELVGGTVAWNQLINSADYRTSFSGQPNVTVTVSGNVWSESGSFTTGGQFRIHENTIDVKKDHVYTLICNPRNFVNESGKSLEIRSNSDTAGLSTTSTDSFFVKKATQDLAKSYLMIFGIPDETYTITVEPIFIDLTQMFGSTIADYIYSLEQATTGSGIAWLKSYGFLTEDYYPYNAGELMSVKTSARKVYDSNSNLLATYPLSNIELRGIPKLVNNQLVYDGDKYEGNGRVTRKYGIRAYQSGDENLTDAITDGTNTVYKLTTSTTEQTSPYDNPQLAGSTEEFVDTREVAIPVGHESKYFNGEGYITYLDPNTSDTIDMAQEHAIMPLETTYISANGTLDVEYWK